MLRWTGGQDGLRLEAAAYRLFFPSDRPYAMLDDAAGERWAELCLASSLNSTIGLDGTARLDTPAVTEADGALFVTIGAESTLWSRKELRFVCRDDRLEVCARVEGHGILTDVHLFGGYYSGHLRWGSGFFQSGPRWRSLFNPEPYGSERRALPASESTALDVLGTSLPGKGHWFFTPPPFCYAVSRAPADGAPAVGAGSLGADQGGTPVPAGGLAPAPGAAAGSGPAPRGGPGPGLPAGPWLAFGLAARPGEHNFVGFHYDAQEGAFSLRLTYEGQTEVQGAFETPGVLFLFDQPDPYAAIRNYVAALESMGLVRLERPDQPAWWFEPIQCGWGAQCHLSNQWNHQHEQKRRAPDFCTQANYDAFLAALAAQDLHPGILVLDDKWSAEYGTCVADPAKWPDLRGWITRRHDAGQKVLLWWKAWDPEGLPAGQCVTNHLGMPVAADPSNPAYEETLRRAVRLMLGPDGYGADGFKVDFSARVPSGPGLRRHGREWGAELLHKLLWILHDEAKRVKPDALVMTHTPNPYFASVTDMIRLNDINTGAPVVGQMVHRARVAAAACPHLVIDTDNWPMPSRAAWREYLQVQLDLGVPSLYFATHLDSMEPLEAEDYAALRAQWAEARRRKPQAAADRRPRGGPTGIRNRWRP